MADRPYIISVGEILWDVFPADGSKRIGGAPLNLAYHASRNSASAGIISAVGNDMLGYEALAMVEKAGLSSCIFSLPYPTGCVEVAVKDGNPEYTFLEDSAYDYIPLSATSRRMVKEASAICFGSLANCSYISSNTLNILLAESYANAIRFFDVNLRKNYYTEELLRRLMYLSHIVKMNAFEFSVIKNMFGYTDDNEEMVCRKIMEKNRLDYLILTKDAECSIIYSPDETSYQKTPEIAVVDTVGAGDAFSGVFLANLLQGVDFRDAHLKAIDGAAAVCKVRGAWFE